MAHEEIQGYRRLRLPRPGKRAGIAVLALLIAAVLAAAFGSLDLGKVGHALVSAHPGWIAVSLALMMGSLCVRSLSWRQTLRAALPHTPIGQMAVTRATMIGVMGSAVFPGRLGEPSRVVVISRRLPAPTKRMLPVVAGTVFSQTLINLLALAILAVVTFTSVPLLHGNIGGAWAIVVIPAAVVAIALIAPRALRRAARSQRQRLREAANATIGLLRLAVQGLRVFARPRHGAPAIAFQLTAWGMQWVACYTVLLALDLQSQADLAAAAAVLLAVNVSAVLPATPSNVGVFQAACLVVLAAYGVAAGPALAYGILLQAVEILTALALGIPALLGEGMSWRDIRRGADESDLAGQKPREPAI